MFSQRHFLVSLIDFYITSERVVICLWDTFGNTFYTSRWLHDGFTTSSSLRIPIASTSYAKLPLRVSFVTASGIIVCPSCVHRVSIGRLRTCFGSTLAFYQIRDENRAKLKISYSCGHQVSKSARYDATLCLLFSRLGFWSGNLFLIAPFPDRCLLVPFYQDSCWMILK